jgi:hypothetical protein
MIFRSLFIAAAIMICTSAEADSVPKQFVYCSAASNSPRGQGLIITQIFRSRSDIAFVRGAFVNFLRTSYAPYGNGWLFSERDASCSSFLDRRKAEIQRSLNISRVPQPVQSIFHVTFEMG